MMPADRISSARIVGTTLNSAEGQQIVDGLGAALDRARQAAGLPLQMEAQRQRVQVAEDAQSDLARRALPDLDKNRITQLTERHRQNARQAIGRDQENGDR